MKSLKFNRLVLVSNTTKSANQYIFLENLNLITGKDNSIGKSTLVKNIFWALGCEPDFDDAWGKLDCKVLLEYSIGSAKMKVLRTNNSIYFCKHGENRYKRFSNITGEYSELLADIVSFKAKLPKRGDDPVLEIPPPAYYFLPFYIDQKRSWTSPWDSFQRLAQYGGWKPSIVKYHTGYLSPEHFEIAEKVFEYEVEKKDANDEIRRISTAIEVVEEYVPRNNVAITDNELEKITDEIQGELSDLSKEQEALFNRLSKFHTSRYHLENQLKIAKRAITEIEKDYKFAVENIEGDKFECPLCGTLHDNSIVSRATILSDKQEITNRLIF